jgi:hypothetical protein
MIASGIKSLMKVSTKMTTLAYCSHRVKYNFTYRSEDNFIDMKKDYYAIL